MHILNKMNIFAYFDYKNAKNACFIVYFVINIYNLILISFILQKNKGFKTLQSINKILNGESDEDNFSCNLTPGQISLLKYAPTTSCDVERSFSQYKAIIRSNRRSFIFENLKKYVVVACNTRSECEL